MRKKLRGFMRERFRTLWCIAILFSLLTVLTFFGNFTTAIAWSATVKVLVVAGGGGGGGDGDPEGGSRCGGGGGAGGFIYNESYPVVAGSYSVTVGNGGASGPYDVKTERGGNGGNSIFDNIIAYGGGEEGTVLILQEVIVEVLVEVEVQITL